MGAVKRSRWALVSLVLLAAFAASAATINVPGDQPTIQAAINVASAGDTIQVAAGTYNETLVINKADLTLLGPNAGKPGYADDRVAEAVIDSGIVNFNDPGVSIVAPGVTIDGFEVSGTSGQFALAPRADGITVKNNVLEVGMCVWVNIDGLTYSNNLVRNTDPAEIYGSVFHNAIYSEGGGSNWTIADNRITEVRNALVMNNEYDKLVFTRNEVVEPVMSGITIGAVVLGDLTMTQNTITSPRHGVYFWHAGLEILANATISITGNEIIGAEMHGVFLSAAKAGDGASVVVEANTIRDGSVAVRVYTAAVAGIVDRIRCNNLVGNTWGVYNDTSVAVDATCNWWGSASGPTHASNLGGNGDRVTNNVTFTPWLVSPYPSCVASGSGDANLDGVVNILDVELVYKAALGQVTLTPAQAAAANVNGDNVVDLTDAQWIAEALICLRTLGNACPQCCP